MVQANTPRAEYTVLLSLPPPAVFMVAKTDVKYVRTVRATFARVAATGNDPCEDGPLTICTASPHIQRGLISSERSPYFGTLPRAKFSDIFCRTSQMPNDSSSSDEHMSNQISDAACSHPKCVPTFS